MYTIVFKNHHLQYYHSCPSHHPLAPRLLISLAFLSWLLILWKWQLRVRFFAHTWTRLLTYGKSSSVSCLGILAGFPFATFCPFVCTFWSEEYPFLLLLWLHVHVFRNRLSWQPCSSLGLPISHSFGGADPPLGHHDGGGAGVRQVPVGYCAPTAFPKPDAATPALQYFFDDTAWPACNTVFVMVKVICQLDWVIWCPDI